MRVSCDPFKRAKTLAERGPDFEDAAPVCEGTTIEIEDIRRPCREPRICCYGLLSGRLVVICYIPRGATRHAFSIPKANHREKARLTPYFEI